jgi:5S rRNA maturation endonuclease (ribonuclease M5)
LALLDDFLEVKNSQNDLRNLKGKLKAKIPEILNYFGVKTYRSGQLLVSKCPIHAGDNITAFNVNSDITSEYCGRWFCNTAGCHKKYGGDVLGLLRGLATVNGNLPFTEVLKLASTFCGAEQVDYVSDVFNDIVLRDKDKPTGPSRQEIRSKLIRPVDFYLKRGFSPEILDIFDVGICNDPTKEMHGRAVFPVYDPTGKTFIGCVGRTLINAPDKWKNQKGFKKSHHLYGLWLAFQAICQSGTLILVEGQGDVIRFHEAGIKNAVGIFGSRLSDHQELLLQKTGVTNVTTVFDRDEAGDKCREDCNRLSRLFNIKHVVPDIGDVGEMSVEEVQGLKL